MTLKIGLCESPKKFAELMASVVEIPSTITIVDSSTGLVNEGTENQRPWGNLIGVNSELYDKLSSIGQEKLCPTFKIKLKSYGGEVLNTYMGCEISFSNYEVAFVFDKFKQPIGLALVLELNNITIN
jgi:hypothetical protein